jgi:hypothetical protein
MMIVNLAVADGYYTGLGIQHRLAKPLGKTTNGQARRAEDRQICVHLAGSIRAAMGQRPQHCLYSEMSGFERR